MVSEAPIYQVFTVLFICVGTITNLISARVYSKKQMRKTSYSTYLFSLAVVDLCVTLTGNTRLAFMYYNIALLAPTHANTSLFNTHGGFDIREYSAVTCRLHIFFTYYLTQLSSTILCFLNLDRVFGVVSTLQARKFCKARTARWLVGVAMMALALVNSHFLAFMGSFADETDDSISSSLLDIKCQASNDSLYHHFATIYFYVDTNLYCIFPFIIMLTCNTLIIGKIVKSRIRSKQVIIRRYKNSSRTKILENKSNTMLGTEKRLSVTLISISVSFLVFTMPVFVIENLQSYRIVSFEEGFWSVAKALAYMLMYMNHVINFFFYCLLGPKFRNEVKKMRPFKWVFKEKEKDSVYPLKISKRITYFQASTGSVGTGKKEAPVVEIMSAIVSGGSKGAEVSGPLMKAAESIEC